MDYSELREKKIFVMDMDGTFYLGDTIIEGSMDFINKLRCKNKKFIFFTNNSSKVSDYYLKKLDAMGLSLEPGTVMTSGDVTINYLKNNYNNSKILLLGTELLIESFQREGIKLVEENPDIVVVGFDTTMSYDKINKACTYIREGALFFATHPDYNCPVENGFMTDCGSMCAMITASTGVLPKYLGKPYKETARAILTATGFQPHEMVVIGDRIYTDIALGKNSGVTSILVLSGETKQKDIDVSDIKPDYVFNSLAGIAEVL